LYKVLVNADIAAEIESAQARSQPQFLERQQFFAEAKNTFLFCILFCKIKIPYLSKIVAGYVTIHTVK